MKDLFFQCVCVYVCVHACVHVCVCIHKNVCCTNFATYVNRSWKKPSLITTINLWKTGEARRGSTVI